VVEVHNELFPDATYVQADPHEDVQPAIDEIVEYINGPLAIEEIVDIWDLLLLLKKGDWLKLSVERAGPV